MVKVQKLILEQFTAFDARTEFEFSRGINVFIGANSTGKTHALKAMYTLLKICERAQLEIPEKPASESGMEQLKVMAQNKFDKVYKPDRIGRLVNRSHRGQKTGRVELIYQDKSVVVEIASKSNKFSISSIALPNPVSSVFLPAHEFLSASQGFIAAYEKRETAFDETYYDLAVALNASPLLGKRQEEIKSLVNPLEKAIQGGKVTENKGKFYVKLPEGNLESPLVAEGYRKLAGLIYLLNNGSLTQNGILFWDEPEANLNPRLVKTIVDTLKTLAASGVQIFISTHDYLFSQELSLLAEYENWKDIRFFAFQQPKRGAGVIIEWANSLAQISHNPILDEFAAHYDRETRLFNQ
ncbi:MAG: AAA family ATPase [Anaerolineales bacterium]